jgi:hypothetical protein
MRSLYVLYFGPSKDLDDDRISIPATMADIHASLETINDHAV